MPVSVDELRPGIEHGCVIALCDTATKRERLHAVRCRWLFMVLYPGGLRAAEVVETRVGAFDMTRRPTRQHLSGISDRTGLRSTPSLLTSTSTTSPSFMKTGG